MQQRLKKALYLQKSGQWAEASTLYAQLLAETPDNILLLDHLAVAYAQGGQLSESAATLTRALSLAPDNARLHNHYGNVLRAQGHIDVALQHYREALRLHPGYAEAYNNMGALYYRQGRIKEAITWLEKAIRLDPEAIDAQYNLANSYVQQDTPLQAIPHYEVVLRLSPQHLGAHHNLGILLATLSQFKEAKPHLKEAMQADTPTLDAHFHYAMALSAEGQCDAAIPLYQQVLAKVPQHAHAHHNIAVMYLTIEDKTNAQHHFEQSLSLNPNNTTALHLVRALQGQTAPQAPEGYIRDLFDHYATHYDAHLGALQYQVPHQLRTLMGQFVHYERTPWVGIDLGCGTGLCAPYFQDLVGKLIGIDLSENMIEVARARGGYTDLHVGDIVTILQKNYINQADLLIAADVLVYYGDLERLFQACSNALKASRYFTFSMEQYDGPDDYILRVSGRFAHSTQYIEKLAQQYHFTVLVKQAGPLRQQAHLPITGRFWILQKRAA